MANDCSTSIYYPYLTLKENWLKLSLLYWERVRRIVPDDIKEEVYKKHDRPEIRQAVDAELLICTPPQAYLNAAAKRFRQNALPLFCDIEQRINRKRVFASLDDNRTIANWVHRQKIDAELQNELIETGIAANDGEWLVMSKQIATVYIVCLASEMANSISEPLVTDTAACTSSGEYMLFGEPKTAPGIQADFNLLASIGVDFPSADSIGHVPMDKILDFREKRFGERKRFREAIDTITTRLSSVSAPEALQDELSDIKKEVTEAFSAHRGAIGTLGVKTAADAFAISVPAALASKWLAAYVALNPAAAALLTSMGVVLTAAKWWATFRSELHKAEREFPWHYAVSTGSWRDKGNSPGGGWDWDDDRVNLAPNKDI